MTDSHDIDRHVDDGGGADADSAQPHLLEVAVALPVAGTFTYRDPRPGARIAAGTQVVVPFGGRTVTGFVLGPAQAAAPAAKTRDIESVVGGEPAFDEQMMALCRWAADYYQAPLGELLRAGLPQGERAESVRLVRLTPAGDRASRGEGVTGQIALGGVGVPADNIDPILRMLSEAARGELSWRAIAKRLGRGAASAAARVNRLERTGLVEVGDDVRDRRAPPLVSFAVAVGSDTDLAPRARARRCLF